MPSATTMSSGAAPESASIRPPLAVDLDGTLTYADTLHEGVVNLMHRSPLSLAALVQSLWDGKAAVKQSVASQTIFDPSLLPYDPALLAYLRAEHEAGRQIGLFTAADQSIADAVADHLGLFSVARGSDGVINLRGEAKTAAIETAFGPSFAYAGNSSADLPILLRADSAILAGPVDRLRTAIGGKVPIEAEFPHPRASLGIWARALRPPHWVKNSLVFVGPILAGQEAAVRGAALAFLLFGILASATYLLNDLMDLSSDRAHPTKNRRPLASGLISVRDGLALALALILGAMAASLLLLPFGCTLALAAYLVVTLLYSAVLKQMAMVDICVLAGLFTLRVLTGSLLVDGPVSPWLLTVAMLFFLGLAAIKRYAELRRVTVTAGPEASARGYSQPDLPILLATGIATGISAIVIFTIYLINVQYPRDIYHRPDALWGVMPVLLIWTLRLWHLAVHGRMNEDPVVFALTDRVSLALGAVFVAIMAVALI